MKKILLYSLFGMLPFFAGAQDTDTSQARAHYNAGWKLKYSNPKKALAHADSAFETATRLGFPEIEIKSMVLQEILLRNRGEMQEAVNLGRMAVEKSRELRNPEWEALSLNEWGTTFLDLTDYEKATQYYDEAIALSQFYGFQRIYMNALLNKGLMHSYQGDLGKAASLLYQSLYVAEKQSDSIGMAHACVNLSIVYGQWGNYTECLSLASRASELYEKLQDKAGLAQVYTIRGNVYFLQNKPQPALEEYQASLFLQKELGDAIGIATGYNNISGVLAAVGKLPEAKAQMLECIALSKEIQNKGHLASSYVNLGGFFGEEKDWENAFAYTDSGRVLAQEIGQKTTLADAYRNLYTLFVEQQKFKDALAYHVLFTDIQDSIRSEKSEQKMQELQIRYGVDKKNQELELSAAREQIKDEQILQQRYLIAMLAGGLLLIGLFIGFFIWYNRSRNRQRAWQYERDRKELEQQVLRAQMNPHFIFNSLNSIQRLYIEQKPDIANEYMGDFSALLRKILNYTERTKISLKEELEALKLYLTLEQLRCGDLLNYTLEIAPDVNVQDARVPPLILQPIVENAIWHGILPKKAPGMIRICIVGAPGGIQCSVEDDGVGFQEKKQAHASKGIELMEKRIGSKTHVEHLNPGTRISFFIRIK